MAPLGLRCRAMAIEPRSRRVELATGIGYHVLEWGGEDPALDHSVILIHGFLDSAWGWERTVRAGLAGRFHVIAPDVRGHGDSDRAGPGGYYHFMDYVADLASLVEEVGRARVSLVGHSMGGSIASYAAGTFPDRVHKLALLEGLGPPEDDTPLPARTASWIAAWRRARERDPSSYPSLEDAAERLCALDPLLDRELARELAERTTVELSGGARRFKHDPLHVTRGPYPFRVEAAQQFWLAVRAPVLLVEGSESTFRAFGEEGERRKACFPGARREILAGAGHMMQRHRPAELARLLAEFLG
jgi:pimeloyl-ACP methyl ester carboxylesterase